MNLHEYQGKAELQKYGVAVPLGIMAETVEEAVNAAKIIFEKTQTATWAVKAQIHAGGRGKGGGVKIANSFEEVKAFADQILGMKLITPQTSAEGKLVKKLYIEQGIYYQGISEVKEFYFGILLNRRESKINMMYSPCGGMNIEQVADETPEFIFTESIDPIAGLKAEQCEQIVKNLQLTGNAATLMIQFAKALHEAYLAMDATLIEINPVVKTSDEKIIAADAKVVIDNSALFRHPEFISLHDLDEEDPTEVEAKNEGLNYIRLDGNVGCMVNGAGLAMATMDIIKLSGASPANFLDVGGSADAERIEKGFRIILKDPNVKAILINIFGGIVRCDRVANGVVAAYKNLGEINVPVIVRLEGTNAIEANKIIDESGLKVFSAKALQEAANLVMKMGS